MLDSQLYRRNSATWSFLMPARIYSPMQRAITDNQMPFLLPSVCLSITRWYCAKTAKLIVSRSQVSPPDPITPECWACQTVTDYCIVLVFERRYTVAYLTEKDDGQTDKRTFFNSTTALFVATLR